MIFFSRLIAAVSCTFAIALEAPAQRLAPPSKVEVTPEHVLSINGKKTFTIGLTGPRLPNAKTPSGKLALQEFRDAGVVFFRPPILEDVAVGDGVWLAYQQRHFDAAARAGMFVMVYLADLASIEPGNQEQERALRRVIRTFKDHPAMGIWKGADEPQWGEEPIGPLMHAYETIHKDDPNHPVWIVQAPRGTVEDLRPYNPTFDITGVDVYPIGYPPGTHFVSEEKNKDISAIGDYTQKMLRVVDGKKPVWFTLQIAWSGVQGEGKTLRFPTFPQQRFMTYQAIINGARGLIYYGGNLPSTLNDRDRPLGWNWAHWDRVLRPVIEEVGDKSPLAAALCAPDSKLPVKVEGNAIEFCVREVGPEVFILACCRDPQTTAKVTFTGLPNDLRRGEVLYESPRKVTAKDGMFTDWFAPYDVHVYKFTRAVR